MHPIKKTILLHHKLVNKIVFFDGSILLLCSLICQQYLAKSSDKLLLFSSLSLYNTCILSLALVPAATVYPFEV